MKRSGRAPAGKQSVTFADPGKGWSSAESTHGVASACATMQYAFCLPHARITSESSSAEGADPSP